jgi:tRNA A37 N6-isopentenylltransferase MiaA
MRSEAAMASTASFLTWISAIGSAPTYRGQTKAKVACDNIARRGRRVILVGGTGFYLRALEVYCSSGRPISSWERPSADVETLPARKFALALDRSALNRVLDERVREMYARGLVEETRALLARFPAAARPFTTIGYREAVAVIGGTMSVAQAMDETARRTRAYAKRQMTWLRAEPGVTWVDAAKPVEEIVEEFEIQG